MGAANIQFLHRRGIPQNGNASRLNVGEKYNMNSLAASEDD